MPPVWKSIFKFRILIPWHIYSVLKQQHQKMFLEQQILILIFRSITTYWQWLMWGIFFSRENVAEKFRFGSQSNDPPSPLSLSLSLFSAALGWCSEKAEICHYALTRGSIWHYSIFFGSQFIKKNLFSQTFHISNFFYF